MNNPIIQLKNICKGFGRRQKHRTVLRDVTASIDTGEIFGIFGNNGAGKSTLLRIIAGQLLPDAGSCLINGVDVVSAPDSARATVGLCGADESSFYGRLTGRMNLRFFGRLHGLDRDLIEQRTTRLLTLLNLQDHADRPVQTYSTGLRQRLNVARTLIHDPPVLIMDEVTKAADPGTADLILALIADRWVGQQGKTVIYVSQDLFGVETLCNRIAILDNGTIAHTGTVDAVLGTRYTSIRHLLRTLNAPAPRPTGSHL